MLANHNAGALRTGTIRNMVRTNKRWVAAAFAVLALAPAIARAQPSTLPATATAAATQDADFEVQEWVVLLCDPSQSHTNARAILTNTLHESIGTRRTNAPEKERNEPRPVGVIRLLGAAEAGRQIDVLLQLKGGTFVAHWPRTQPRVNRLLWRNVVMSTDAPTLPPLPEKHWLEALRRGESAYITSDRGNERFLLYDVELPYKPPVKLAMPEGAKGAKEGEAVAAYKVGNTSSAPLHNFVIYRPVANGGWTSGSLALVPGGRGSATTQAATQATTQPSTAPATQAAAVAATTSPATTQSFAAASTQPTIDLPLAPVASADQLLEPWREKLAAAGLSPTDLDLILSVIRGQLNPRHATVVYQLDPGEFDRLLPLEVIPAPRKTTRVALVIVRNIDPALEGEIDRLIAQLGHDEYGQREDAYKQLAGFGAAAQPKLQAALKHKDLEVVYRAERLIQQITKPTTPAQ